MEKVATTVAPVEATSWPTVLMVKETAAKFVVSAGDTIRREEPDATITSPATAKEKAVVTGTTVGEAEAEADTEPDLEAELETDPVCVAEPDLEAELETDPVCVAEPDADNDDDAETVMVDVVVTVIG